MSPPRALVVLVGIVIGLGACDRRPDPVAYRRALIERMLEDHRVHATFVEEMQRPGRPGDSKLLRVGRTDSVNAVWLKPLVLRHGFPARALVGDSGVLAAFLLVQHADHDPGFQAAVLPMLERAFSAGDVPGEALAMLTDRVLRSRGRPQRYGTQMRMEGRRVRLDPVEDSSGLEARRARMGLVPMADYLRAADSAFAARPRPT